MTRKVSLMHQYLRSSRTIHYSLILTLPALAIYEFGILFLFQDSFFELRNSGEILLWSVFTKLGLNNPYIVSTILLSIFLFVMIRGYQVEKKPGINANYFIYMLLEGMLWGGVIFIALQLFTQLPLQIITFEEKLSNMNLAIGAGIFEELIFRMILISAFLVILERGLSLSSNWAALIAIFLAACVFAAFHLFMEMYSFPIFTQRVFGGVLLGVLYRYRGYGISVYSHIIFNFLILAESW